MHKLNEKIQTHTHNSMSKIKRKPDFILGIIRFKVKKEINFSYGFYSISQSKTVETYLEPCQKSKVECFAKIVNGYKSQNVPGV